MPTATSDEKPPRRPVRLAAGDLEVVFDWAGDRWRHRVAHRGRTILESVEGPGPAGDPRWPVSPALQEVSAAVAAGRPAVLAVGAAGRTHFSASLTADPSAADAVLVEVACRTQEPAGWLGSTYRAADGGLLPVPAGPAAVPPCTVEWRYRLGPRGVEPAPGRPAAEG